jgi:signal transduction histidine kinase
MKKSPLNTAAQIQHLEQTLQFEKNCFNFVLATIPYVVLHIDENFVIRHMNEFARHVLGFLDNPPTEQNIFDFIYMDKKNETKNLFFKPDADLISFHARWHNPDKTFLWDCLKRPFSTLESGYICIGKDLTLDLPIDNNNQYINTGCSLDDISKNYGNTL